MYAKGRPSTGNQQTVQSHSLDCSLYASCEHASSHSFRYNEGSSTPAIPKPWMVRASCSGVKVCKVAFVCLAKQSRVQTASETMVQQKIITVTPIPNCSDLSVVTMVASGYVREHLEWGLQFLRRLLFVVDLQVQSLTVPASSML